MNEKQNETRAWAREFAEKIVAPRAAEMDRNAAYDRSILDAMFEHGLMGMLVPSEFGGRGATALEYATAVEELARCSS